MTNGQQIGRVILIALLLLMLAPELFIAILKVTSTGILIEDIVRFLLTAALAYCVWSGMRWAKWLAVFLATVAGIVVIVLGTSTSPVILAVGVMYLAIAISLGFIPAVQEFLAYQRKSQ